MTGIEWLRQGGPVLWILVVMALSTVVVFLERLLHLRRARIVYQDFLKGIFTVLDRGNTQEALTISEETPGPVACLVRTAIQHRHEDRETIRQALTDVGHAEISRMERRLVALATIAQIAPLLGLLGTVLGILDTVLVMRAQTPVVQVLDVTDGMLRALITTGAGLMVALPCYGMFNLLVINVDRIVLDMEQAASEVTAYMTGRHARAAKDADG